MAKYRVKQKSFIGNAIREEGDVVEYEGVPSDNLEPLDAPARAAVDTAGAANLESVVRQRVAAAGASPDEVDTTAAISAAAKAAEGALTAQTASADLV